MLSSPCLCYFKQPEETEIYDSVTDEQYRSIVGSRNDRDDFIEDDDGGDYVDHGLEDWNDAERDDEESEDEDDFEGEDEELREGM